MKSVGRIGSLTHLNPNKRSPAKFSILYHPKLAINRKEKFVFDLTLFRVYADTPSEHKLTNVAGGGVNLQKQNFPDTGMWFVTTLP